ncbi:MAG: hypothetical protein CVU51_13165 [Deltaproteobacteria bacterium HGW-Deltaproteobacteria-1]|jgi:chromosome segregation ATPase|nr:MAG: hypothetical protein CVU51_13165 [Deltaproteobacteria bacterium HGW-Deltaproteobacteria-1]
MIIHSKRLIYLVVLTAILLGCATTGGISNNADQKNTAQHSSGFFSMKPSDKEIFTEALSFLSNDGKEPQYNEAKIRLENLIQQYPKSKWADAAKALLVSLNRISELELKLDQTEQKQEKLTHDLTMLSNKSKQAEERHTAEISRLQQENEELAKGLQQLKNLEIQLEKIKKRRR